MIISAVIQALFKLTLAVMAILVARSTLLWLDRKTGMNFFEILQGASANAQLAYFSARFIGVCILVGLVVS